MIRSVKVLFLCSVMSFGCVADDSVPRDLMPRTRMPDSPPKHTDIYVYEEWDAVRKLIVKKMDYKYREWVPEHRVQIGYNRYRVEPGFYRITKGSHEVSTRAWLKPTELLPVAPMKDPVDPEHAETPERVVKESGRVVVPRNAQGNEQIPDSFPQVDRSEGAESSKKVTILPLLGEEPEAMVSIDWAESWKGADEQDFSALLDELKRLKTAVLQWQSNMHGRFGLCPVDKMEAKQNGTLEQVYVPYQVVSGRIYLLKVELGYLISQIEKGSTPEEWVATLLRVVRRMEAIESMANALKKDKDLAFFEVLEESKRALMTSSEEINPFESKVDKQWILRWQVIAQNLAVFEDRSQKLGTVLDKSSRELVEKTREAYSEAAKLMGDAPWELSVKKQNKIARLIYTGAQETSKVYERMAQQSDETTEAKAYLNRLGLLGSNEDLRVASYFILDVIQDQE
jgi:hypothetical protein